MHERRSPHKDSMQLCLCTFPYGLHGPADADLFQDQVSPMAFIRSGFTSEL